MHHITECESHYQMWISQSNINHTFTDFLKRLIANIHIGISINCASDIHSIGCTEYDSKKVEKNFPILMRDLETNKKFLATLT